MSSGRITVEVELDEFDDDEIVEEIISRMEGKYFQKKYLDKIRAAIKETLPSKNFLQSKGIYADSICEKINELVTLHGEIKVMEYLEKFNK